MKIIIKIKERKGIKLNEISQEEKKLLRYSKSIVSCNSCFIIFRRVSDFENDQRHIINIKFEGEL